MVPFVRGTECVLYAHGACEHFAPRRDPRAGPGGRPQRFGADCSGDRRRAGSAVEDCRTRRLSRRSRRRTRPGVRHRTDRSRGLGGSSASRSCPAWSRPLGMTLILDAGGLSALAGDRAKLAELRRRGLWPGQVPSVVLAESLTGDHRRDFHTNRLLRACQIRDVGELQAREAARLRTATRSAASISAVAAVVAAFASTCLDPVVVTSDPGDLTKLAAHTVRSITVVGV